MKMKEEITKPDLDCFAVFISGSVNKESWWCGITTKGEFKHGGVYKPDRAAQTFWNEVVKFIKTHAETINEIRASLKLSKPFHPKHKQLQFRRTP